MKIIINSTLIALLAMLTGCVAPYKISLKEKFDSTKHKIHVSTHLPQKEIFATSITNGHMPVYIPVQNSSAGALAVPTLFGVALGLAIVAAISEKEEKKYRGKELEPLKKALKGYDFSSVYHQSMGRFLEEQPLFSMGHHFTKQDFSRTTVADGEYLLEFNSKYNLNNDFSAFELSSDVQLSRVSFRDSRRNKTEIKGGKIVKAMKEKVVVDREVIFKNRYRYISGLAPRLIKTEADIEKEKQNINEWYLLEKAKIEKMVSKKLIKMKIKKLNEKKRKKLSVVKNSYPLKERNLALITHWSKNDSKEVRASFNKALSEISKMFLLDFSDTLPANQHSKNKTLERYKRKFQLVSKTNDRMIVRSLFGKEIGTLISLPVEVN